jgi:hypothetical protein
MAVCFGDSVSFENETTNLTGAEIAGKNGPWVNSKPICKNLLTIQA